MRQERIRCFFWIGKEFDSRRKAGGLLFSSVVFVAVNRRGIAVLLAVDLCLFPIGQGSPVGGTVAGDFMVYDRFPGFHVRGFTGSQLSALDTLGDALLLITLALADLALGISVLHQAIVLVAVNAAR